ncbi:MULTISPECIES: recombinase family protein [Lactobacillus]|uniref:recombinase family protein n=1 Tax=Lactobacillus TaxID=1578 RepID=UPI00195CC016|nr:MULTISPECIES: recombinase family protein [Lactobacillus]MBM6873725.1 recombinase family protein [Lactobacillus crispatus]MBM6958869.1 recombinase family protein [Lactobacillus gallinarum]MBM6973820.1 recombinase family protein [Lactobacillus gallinarum]MDM8290832.1 recombinase family protein [Lactobacillus crispatus]
MNTIYGYARVSTVKQDLSSQVENLKRAGAVKIFKDKYTGTTANRPEFDKLMAKIKSGDTLIVTKLDRLARNTQDALNIVKKMNAEGVILRVLNIGTIDNSPSGRLIFTVFSAFAEFERDLIVSRTQEGKAWAKANNPNFHEGMPRKYNQEQIDFAWKLHTQDHMSYSEISKKLGISKATIYRRFRELKQNKKATDSTTADDSGRVYC